ncbi:hypothetical protein BSPA111_33800 [Buttiauxella sp. A111]|nr:hypothetical protein BSPA111_33800 [Buttiauxella sp. A111]
MGKMQKENGITKEKGMMEGLRFIALTPALSPRRGRKPSNPLALKERKKTEQSPLLQGEG